jgi:hypothetical protein
MHLAQNRAQLWALVRNVMSFQVPLKAGNFLTSLATISFSKGLSSIEVVSYSNHLTLAYGAGNENIHTLLSIITTTTTTTVVVVVE